MGKVANEYPRPNQVLKGILVSKDFQHTIVDPEDIGTYTNLQLGAVRNTIIVPLNRSAMPRVFGCWFHGHTSQRLHAPTTCWPLVGAEQRDYQVVEVRRDIGRK